MSEFLESKYLISMKIREMNTEMRPREKAVKYGMKSLTDLELLMLILGSGTKNYSVDKIAQKVLEQTDNLVSLMELDLKDLIEIPGIQKTKALQILGGIELSKRALRCSCYSKKIDDPKKIADWFLMEYGFKKQENVIVIFLNSQLEIIDHKCIFMGTLNSSDIHPREVYKEALRCSAFSIILVHNHRETCSGMKSAGRFCLKFLTDSIGCFNTPACALA